MANEAGLAVVVRMRDEASTKMQNFGKTTAQARVSALELKTAMMAVGMVFAQASSLLSQMDNPMAKTAGGFLRIAAYAIQTSVAIALVIPQLKMLVTWLKQVAVMQAIVAALSGPKGWIALGAAVAVGVGATALVARSGRSERTQTTSRTTVVNNNIAGSVITERELGEITRREIIKAQERSGTSGIR